jgi:Thioredoxin-like
VLYCIVFAIHFFETPVEFPYAWNNATVPTCIMRRHVHSCNNSRMMRRHVHSCNNSRSFLVAWNTAILKRTTALIPYQRQYSSCRPLPSKMGSSMKKRYFVAPRLPDAFVVAIGQSLHDKHPVAAVPPIICSEHPIGCPPQSIPKVVCRLGASNSKSWSGAPHLPVKGFTSYYQTMPWMAIPYDDVFREQLMAAWKVRGIPRLVVYDCRSGTIVEENAVGKPLDLSRWRKK